MEGHNFESNIFKESDAFQINPSTQDQEEEEALADQRRRDEELHDLIEGAFIDITNDNSEDDSDFQSTFNATESANCNVVSIPGEPNNPEKIDTEQFQNCVNLLKKTIQSIRSSTVQVQRNVRRLPTESSVQYPSTTPSNQTSGTTLCSSVKKSSTSEEDGISYYSETFTLYNSHRSDTLQTYSSNMRTSLSSDTNNCSKSQLLQNFEYPTTTFLYKKGMQNGQWNDSEYESNGNLFVETPQSLTTPTYDASSAREYYDEGISHSNLDSPISDTNQQQNQMMQQIMKPRRRYWSTQHVSSLTPLKEIESVHVESDGDVEQQFIEEYNQMEIADSNQLVLMYQARVRDCEKLSRRVAELEENFKLEINQKDAIINKKEMELETATMTFGVNKSLLVEAQQKVKDYKALVEELTKEKDIINTERTKLEYELENTRKELIESEHNFIYTKSKMTEDHVAQIYNINTRQKDEIKKLEQLVDEQATKLQDMQKRITDLTHVNDNLMTNQYDLTKRMNNMMNELSTERDNSRHAKEEASALKDVVSERDILKRQVKDLEEKLNELLYEIAKIEKEKYSGKRDRYQQTVDNSLTSNSLEIELKRSLESLRLKRDEIAHMKEIISEQQQMINMLNTQSSQGVSAECQTSEELTKLRNQGEQTDLLSNDIHQYKIQLNKLEQEITQKDIDLNKYCYKLKKLENDFDELKQNDTKQSNDYNRLHQDYEKLASDYQKRGETIENLQKELESLRNDFISFQENSAQQFLTKQDARGDDLNNYQQLIGTIRNELQIMSNKNKNIKTTLLEKINELRNVSEENQELHKKIMELEIVKEQHDKCYEEITTLRNSLAIRNQNSEAFQTVIENLKSKLREAEERLMHVCDIENTNKSLRKQLKRNNDHYDSVRNEIHTMRTNLVKFIGEQLTDIEDNFDCSNTEETLLRQLASLKHIYEKIIRSKSQVIQAQLLEIQKLQNEIEKYRNFDKEVRETIEAQINALKVSCEEKMANAKKECYRILNDNDESITTQSEKMPKDVTTVDRINELVTQLSHLKKERERYVQSTDNVDELMYRIQNFELQNANLLSQLERANQDLETSKQKINALQKHEATILALQKQIQQLETIITQYNKNKSSSSCSGNSDIRELQQQLITVQAMHTQEIDALQKSLKEVMKQEIETIQNQFHKKIVSLESEKTYLENCLRSVEQHSKDMIEKFQQERNNMNMVIESNVTKIHEMTTKIASFDQREIDWKEKEAALLKEKRTLTKGLDKFAKAMLELYIKHKHMSGEMKRMKEEKHSCFEYAYCLKKKLNQLKDQVSCSGAGAPTSSQPRVRRSLSESSTPLNTTALQVNQQAMRKSSSIQHSSRVTKKNGSKLPISSVKLKINSKATHKRTASRLNTSSHNIHSSSSLDAPQIVEAYRNRNRIRKSSVSKE